MKSLMNVWLYSILLSLNVLLADCLSTITVIAIGVDNKDPQKM